MLSPNKNSNIASQVKAFRKRCHTPYIKQAFHKWFTGKSGIGSLENVISNSKKIHSVALRRAILLQSRSNSFPFDRKSFKKALTIFRGQNIGNKNNSQQSNILRFTRPCNNAYMNGCGFKEISSSLRLAEKHR